MARAGGPGRRAHDGRIRGADDPDRGKVEAEARGGETGPRGGEAGPGAGNSRRMKQRLVVSGVVQGVGFRPFVYRLAHEEGLNGWVRNAGGQVEIEVEGEAAAVAAFRRRLVAEAPPLARIEAVRELTLGRDEPAREREPEQPDGSRSSPGGGFVILPSISRRLTTAGGYTSGLRISPDVAICAACRRELFDPGDRRYLYPFINCTDCGPRYTIMEKLPYDRPFTSMRPFELCPDCRREYEDPSDRRFHAQPIACPACGPALVLAEVGTDGAPRVVARLGRGGVSPTERENFWHLVRERLQAGEILALQGLGGFHLACDARQREAVGRLRERKRRPHKPLAVMMQDLATVERYCYLSEAERATLTSPAAPILLLRLRSRRQTDLLAPGLGRLGVMLPYTPLHLLLFDAEAGLDALVMTSGNLSGLPLAATPAEAFRELSGIADLILFHNRRIVRRLDDSVAVVVTGEEGTGDGAGQAVARKPELQIIRRARGFIPEPLELGFLTGGQVSGQGREQTSGSGADRGRGPCPSVILGLGGEQNNAFALLDLARARIYPGPHVGDLGTVEMERHLERQLASFCELLQLRPQAVVVDAHPAYRSRRLGERLAAQAGWRLQYVQHHEAHVAAVMAEAGWEGNCLGVAADGTGWGSDGRIWGGEVFAVERLDRPFRRVAHLEYLPLAGGESAIRRPFRLAVAYTAVLAPEMMGWLEEHWANWARRASAGSRMSRASQSWPEPERRREIREIGRLAARVARRPEPQAGGRPPTGQEAGWMAGQMAEPAAEPQAGPGAGPGSWILTSSLGRLFDAAAALLGLVDEVTYEGQAAMQLEALAEGFDRRLEVAGGGSGDGGGAEGTGEGVEATVIRVGELWRELLQMMVQQKPAAAIAHHFQYRVVGLLEQAVGRAAAKTGFRRVVLGGGCFHNRYLSRELRRRLEAAGLVVAEARAVSPGDGGLAVGQAVLAAARGKWASR